MVVGISLAAIVREIDPEIAHDVVERVASKHFQLDANLKTNLKICARILTWVNVSPMESPQNTKTVPIH